MDEGNASAGSEAPAKHEQRLAMASASLPTGWWQAAEQELLCRRKKAQEEDEDNDSAGSEEDTFYDRTAAGKAKAGPAAKPGAAKGKAAASVAEDAASLYGRKARPHSSTMFTLSALHGRQACSAEGQGCGQRD